MESLNFEKRTSARHKFGGGEAAIAEGDTKCVSGVQGQSPWENFGYLGRLFEGNCKGNMQSQECFTAPEKMDCVQNYVGRKSLESSLTRRENPIRSTIQICVFGVSESRFSLRGSLPKLQILATENFLSLPKFGSETPYANHWFERTYF